MVPPTVTVAVPVLDEERHIGACLDAVEAQTYPAILEVLVVDGGSIDATRSLVEARPGVRLLHNPRRIQAAALNIALAEAKGDVFVRVDGHCLVAADYVERCVEALVSTGAAMVGGGMTPVAHGARQRGIAAAMGSRMGAGPARFHVGGRPGWVDTVYLGAYRAATARAAGGYAEDVGVNEDAELAIRMKHLGGVWFDPTIRSTYTPRSSYPAVARQFYRYGRSRALTVRRHPRSLSPRQLAAPLLVLALASRWRRQAAAAYATAVGLAVVHHSGRVPSTAARLGLALPSMHLPWGVGFLQGLVSPQHPSPQPMDAQHLPPAQRTPLDRRPQALPPRLHPPAPSPGGVGLEQRANAPGGQVDGGRGHRQVLSGEDDAVAHAQGRYSRRHRTAPGGRPVLNGETGIVEEVPSGRQQPQAELDLLGGVEEALVVASHLQHGLAAGGVGAAHEVGARSGGPARAGPSPEGVLAGLHVTAGPVHGEGDHSQPVVGEPLPQGLGHLRGEHGVVVQEQHHVGAGVGQEPVAASGDADVVVAAEQVDTRLRIDGRLRGHVEHDDLVPGLTCGGGERLLQLPGPVVADDPEGDRGHLTRMAVGPRATLRRTTWGVADQFVSSITNFALAVVVARSVEARSFGAFAVAMSVYGLGLGAARALVGEPVAIRHAMPGAHDRPVMAEATGTALALGVLCGFLLAAISAVGPAATRIPLLALALGLPGLLLQDAWRFVFVSAGRAGRAFANDLVWALAQVVTVGSLLVLGGAGVGSLILAWGASATLAAAVGCLQAGQVPSIASATRWLRRHRDLWPRLGAELAAMTGSWQIVMFLIGALAGLAALGALRAAQTLLGPVSIVFLAAPLVAVPELSRRFSAGGKVLRTAAAISAGLATLALLGGVAVSALPDGLGQALLGASFEPARPLILPVALFLASTGVNIGALAGLRGLDAVDRSLRARLRTSPMLVGCGALGAVLGGASGAAAGLALANWVASVLWWRVLIGAARAGRR